MNNSGVWLSGILTFALILLLLTTGCVTTPSEETPAYTVGVNGNYPPYSYYNTNGELVGFDVDVIKEIAKTEGLDIRFKQIDWIHTLPSLVSGDIDIYTSHLVITPDRKKLVAFSNPYGQVGQAIAVKNGTNFTYDQFLSGELTIAVQGTTINSEWVKATLGKDLYTTMADEGRILLYDTFPQSMMAVSFGLTDCAVFDDGDVRYYIQNPEGQPDRDLKILTIVDTNEQYGIAVRQDNPELLEKVNRGLDKIMNSENWTRLTAKYLMTE